ncbi:hypothetical protein Y1Q_0017628 [Alligator mississippiensis]|uniref:acid phosphatase n=1 Tax=Alligator mississippiensis TaxID=8496 RepID=A0A151P2Q4_ALLMI|nr:hypothetical protein Y1Q_0017628 [Alligator mississippiensis]
MRVRQLLCGIWSLCFLLCLLFILLHQTTAKRKLKFVSLLGIQQQYMLGQYLRKRYAHYLSTIYKQCEIYVQSTDSDQTLMSAQATLAGLYPLDSGQAWNPKILWQPIPVHTVPLSHDHMAYIVYYMVNHDYLYMVTPEVFGFNQHTLKEEGACDKGILLKAILKHLSDARKPSNQRKMIIYSAHAATIVALQMALHVFNGKLPPYSACHFFELYQEKNGQYTIEIHGAPLGKRMQKIEPKERCTVRSSSSWLHEATPTQSDIRLSDMSVLASISVTNDSTVPYQEKNTS